MEVGEFVRVAALLLHGDASMARAAPAALELTPCGSCVPHDQAAEHSARHARRRKQLMRMAGDDAILILPAAAGAHPQQATRTTRTARTATSGT